MRERWERKRYSKCGSIALVLCFPNAETTNTSCDLRETNCSVTVYYSVILQHHCGLVRQRRFLWSAAQTEASPPATAANYPPVTVELVFSSRHSGSRTVTQNGSQTNSCISLSALSTPGGDVCG